MSEQQIQDERNELAAIIKHARKTGDRHTLDLVRRVRAHQRTQVYRHYSLLRAVRQGLAC